MSLSFLRHVCTSMIGPFVEDCSCYHAGDTQRGGTCPTAAPASSISRIRPRTCHAPADTANWTRSVAPGRTTGTVGPLSPYAPERERPAYPLCAIRGPSCRKPEPGRQSRKPARGQRCRRQVRDPQNRTREPDRRCRTQARAWDRRSRKRCRRPGRVWDRWCRRRRTQRYRDCSSSLLRFGDASLAGVYNDCRKLLPNSEVATNLLGTHLFVSKL